MTDTTTELESVQELLDKDEQARARAAKKAPRGFDPACVFLLKMNPINLFDPIGRDGLRFRCKGCGAEVASTKRKPHHAQHVRALAKSSGSAYPATRDSASEARDITKEEEMTATKKTTRSSSRSRTATAAPARKSGAAGAVAAAKKTGSATKSTTTAKKKTGATGAAARGQYVEAAAAYLKGKKPMPAKQIAEALCKTHAGWVPYNVAFAIYKAEREGKIFKRNNDRPALISLR